MVGPLDAMRERMESEWTLSWLAHWMLCGNGWSLSGRYHGWPIGCYAGTDGVSVDVTMVGPLDAMRERMESEWTLSWLAHWMLCGNGWSLSGRYHGWPIGCYAGTDGVSVDVTMVGPLDAMRERMESEWTLSWLAHWMLCGNGWSLSGRYHGWPLGCLQRVRERLDGGRKSGNQHLQTCATTARHVQEGEVWANEASTNADLLRSSKDGMSKGGIRAALAQGRLKKAEGEASRIRERTALLCDAVAKLEAESASSKTNLPEVDQLLYSADQMLSALDTSVKELSAEQTHLSESLTELKGGLEQQMAEFRDTLSSFASKRNALEEERSSLARRLEE
ncbi:unnamed protein product, partial [Symbiodinium sp. CCMP2592]